jgi:hypothetical protein
MYIIGFIFIIIEILPGFLIAMLFKHLYELSIEYRVRTKGTVSYTYRLFLTLILIVIASLIIIYTTIYSMQFFGYIGHRLGILYSL